MGIRIPAAEGSPPTPSLSDPCGRKIAGRGAVELYPRRDADARRRRDVVRHEEVGLQRFPRVHPVAREVGDAFTGNFLIDDTFLASAGVTDFARYRVDASEPLQPDFFVPDDIPPPPGVSVAPRV